MSSSENLEQQQLNKEYLTVIEELCAPHPHAFRWFNQLLDVVKAWDALIDGDKITPLDIDNAFIVLTLEWGFNGFWMKYANSLIPIMAAAINAWKWSNQPESDKIKAYDIYTEIPAVIAFLLGGTDSLKKHMPKIRQLASQMCLADDHADNGSK